MKFTTDTKSQNNILLQRTATSLSTQQYKYGNNGFGVLKRLLQKRHIFSVQVTEKFKIFNLETQAWMPRQGIGTWKKCNTTQQPLIIK